MDWKLHYWNGNISQTDLQIQGNPYNFSWLLYIEEDRNTTTSEKYHKKLFSREKDATMISWQAR